jgi:uncharacterized protein (PEP-CTERM system associated)
VKPHIAIAGIYSDNVQLAASGLEESEFITQIVPSISIDKKSERLDLAFKYSYEYLDYAEESDRNESFNQAEAHVLAELLRERFYVDVDGGLTQQVVDPEEAFPPSNLPLTFNRTDAIDAVVAPYWRQPLGGVGDLLMRYERGVVEYDEPTLHDLDRQHAIVTLESPRGQRGVTWGFNYDYDRQVFDVVCRPLEAEDPPPTQPCTATDPLTEELVPGGVRDPDEAEFEEAALTIGYWVSSNVHMFATGGAESDFREHRSTAELDEGVWEAGLNYVVAERDDFLVSFGERAFGSTMRLRWLHEFRGLDLRVEYFEEPSTNAEARFDRRGQPDDFESEVGLDRPDDADTFVRERFEAVAEIGHGRSNWTVMAYHEKRTDRVPAEPEEEDPAQLGDEETLGTSADWLWRVGSRTDLGFGVDWERSEFADGNDFDVFHASAEARYALGERTGLRLRLEHASRDGDRDTSTLGDASNYDESRVSLFFERAFF